MVDAGAHGCLLAFQAAGRTVVAGRGPQQASVRQAWYGPAYVHAICSQAGYLWQAVPSDGDVHSFDGNLTVRPGSTVPVQVKCRRKKFESSCSYRIKRAWRENWDDLAVPGFFVVVVVPADVSAWVEHEDNPVRRTIHQTSAYWTRIDPLPPEQKSIQVLAANRFTADTIPIWCQMYEETISGFRGGRQ
jgi:hypothetical protein